MLVGLMGHKRTGKDTIGDYLVEAHGFHRVAFADPLRRAAYGLNPIVSAGAPDNPLRLAEVVDNYGWEKAKELPEVRRTLQRFGTESIRSLDPEFWVRMGMAEAAKHENAVITDVRYPNEAEAVEKAGGVTIKVLRETGLTDAHASEVALDDWTANWTLNNDGSLESLYDCVSMALQFSRQMLGGQEVAV